MGAPCFRGACTSLRCVATSLQWAWKVGCDRFALCIEARVMPTCCLQPADLLPATRRPAPPRPPRAGVTDHLAENEPHALSLARSILANINSPAHAGTGEPWGQRQAAQQQLAAAAAAGGGAVGAPAWEEPRFSPEELRGGGAGAVFCRTLY